MTSTGLLCKRLDFYADRIQRIRGCPNSLETRLPSERTHAPTPTPAPTLGPGVTPAFSPDRNQTWVDSAPLRAAAVCIKSDAPFFSFLTKHRFYRGLHTAPLFSCIQNSKTLQDSPSHRIIKHMHEVLNVAKQNN